MIPAQKRVSALLLQHGLFAGNDDAASVTERGLQGLQPFGLSDKPLSIEGNISLPPRRNPAARSYRLHIDPRYLDHRH